MANFDPRQAGSYIELFDYDGNNNIIYYGRAVPGTASSAAAWMIQSYTYSGSNVTATKFAGGNNQMVSVWDNRAALSYS